MHWERRPAAASAPEELLRRFSARIQQLSERARAAVRAAVPTALEHVQPNRGYFGYRLAYQFAFIEPLQDYVQVGFALGGLLADPARLLLAAPSRTVRYVRLERPADARRVELATLLQLASTLVPPKRPARGRVQLQRTTAPKGRGRRGA